MDDEVKKAAKPADMGTVVLMLGLYLIILAFFILLNTMAVISDEKVQQASESVADGFGFQRSGEVKIDDVQSITLNPVFNAISADLESLVETHISVEDFNFEQYGDTMVLRLQQNAVFFNNEARILPDLATFFNELARTINRSRPGIVMHSEIVAHQPKGTPLELAGRRTSLMTRALIERGVIAQRISAGAINDDTHAGTIVVTFRPHIQDKQSAMAHARDLLGLAPLPKAAPLAVQPATQGAP